jgi:hypothetical protein
MFHKSCKQRRAEIKAARRKKARKLAGVVNVYQQTVPRGAVAANHVELAHNNTYGLLPNFYVDRPFTCCDCGAKEIWTAKQQRWWYEIAKGHIDSVAIRCRPCRKVEQSRKADERKVHLDGVAKKHNHAMNLSGQ